MAKHAKCTIANLFACCVVNRQQRQSARLVQPCTTYGRNIIPKKKTNHIVVTLLKQKPDLSAMSRGTLTANLRFSNQIENFCVKM